MSFFFFLKEGVIHWRQLLKNKQYKYSLLTGIVLILIAFFLNHLLSSLTDTFEVLSVGDLILDHLPVYNLNFLYTVGFYTIILIIILYPLLFKPEIAPFCLKTFAFFVIIRSIFIILTHIGPSPIALKIMEENQQASFFYKTFYKNDFFFSGHTGIPFLAFLIFYKENILLSYFFLFSSFLMGATVLLMHYHYSIDVFSAYFITYSIYKVSDQIFNNLNVLFKKIVTDEKIFIHKIIEQKAKIAQGIKRKNK